MKRIVVFATLLVASSASAASYTATGLVSKVKIVSTATSAEAKLRVTLRSETGTTKVICKNGTTSVYEGGVSSADQRSIGLVQSLLTAAMLSQHSVDVVSAWNGSYCEIQTVTFED